MTRTDWIFAALWVAGWIAMVIGGALAIAFIIGLVFKVMS